MNKILVVCGTDFTFNKFLIPLVNQLVKQRKIGSNILAKHYKLEEINAALNDLESGRVFRPLIVRDYGE